MKSATSIFENRRGASKAVKFKIFQKLYKETDLTNVNIYFVKLAIF